MWLLHKRRPVDLVGTSVDKNVQQSIPPWANFTISRVFSHVCLVYFSLFTQIVLVKSLLNRLPVASVLSSQHSAVALLSLCQKCKITDAFFVQIVFFRIDLINDNPAAICHINDGGLSFFLSDPGVPGVRSMGPVLSHKLTLRPF